MTVFIKVNSNLNHNGQTYQKGSVFEAEQGEFQQLINNGVLSVIDGAENITEAEQIASTPEVVEATQAEEVVTPNDTWGPQPDVPVVESQADGGDTNTPEVVEVDGQQPVETTDSTTQPELTGEEL